MFFEGQNSELFHIAKKIGQAFRYSLMMYELKRRIGKNIKVHIGEVIPFEKIKKIGDLIKITKFLRNNTFELDPDNKKKTDELWKKVRMVQKLLYECKYEKSYEYGAEDFLNSVETQVKIRGTLSIKQRQALNKMYKRFKKRIEKSA